METVIAIGVLAVLLTGFIAVFTPAAQGIRRSISAQQADRLTTTLEKELVTFRTGQEIPPTPGSTTPTGFEKAYTWLKEGLTAPEDAIFVYQYRGKGSRTSPADGTLKPLNIIDGQPGKDYTVQSMARRASDPLLKEDLKAIVGSVFYVKPTQLVFKGGQMILSTTSDQITFLDGTGAQANSANAAAYKEAVIAFSAEFYSVPSKSADYLLGDSFKKRFNTAKRPVFTRNLAVRR